MRFCPPLRASREQLCLTTVGANGARVKSNLGSYLAPVRRLLARLANPEGWIETVVLPSSGGPKWTHPTDDFDFARTSRLHSLTYTKDSLAGFSYTPWVTMKLVPPISIADRRLRSDRKRFSVQLIAQSSSYKHCKTPVQIWLAGAPFDFVPDQHRFGLAKWHQYLSEMAHRKHRVFVTLEIAATSVDHEFSLLIPSMPPRLKPMPRVKA